MKIIGVTNRKLYSNFYSRITEIAKENVLQYLILREKDLDDKELLEMALKIKKIILNSDIKLIINNNISVAEEVDAFGVQLSFNNFIEKGKKLKKGIIGVSIHSLDEAIEAERLGADYLLYGHVFETDCKKGLKPRGLDELREINKIVKIPVYAIGGINSSNYKKVLDVGTTGIAVMSGLVNSYLIERNRTL